MKISFPANAFDECPFSVKNFDVVIVGIQNVNTPLFADCYIHRAVERLFAEKK